MNRQESSSESKVVAFVALSGGTLALLGLIVMAGWHSRIPPLIQILPGFVPMQYNTALGFFLSGCGLLCLQFRRQRLLLLCASATLLLGALTLAQYLTGMNFGIDELLMQHFIVTNTSHPGRMAPNTALAFIISSLTLLALIRSRDRPGASAIVVPILAAIIMAIATVALFGYVSGIEPAYGWGQFTQMAVHTALGFALLATGILADVWSSHRQGPDRGIPNWAVVTVGVAATTITLSLHQALVAQEQTHIERTTATITQAAKDEISSQMESRILALVRMAQRWKKPGRTKKELWQSDAALYRKHFPALWALACLDAAGQLRWKSPDKSSGSDSMVWSQKHIGPALQHARTRKGPALSPLLSLPNEKKGVAICVPVFLGDHFDGHIVGILQVETFLDAVNQNVAAGYATVVSNEENEDTGKAETTQWVRDTTLPIKNVEWHLRIYPTAPTLASLESSLPEVTLVMGVALTVLLIWSTHLFSKTRQHAAQLNTANQQLKRENKERMQAERRLHRAIENAPFPIMIHAEDGEVLQISRSWTELTGYEPDDIPTTTAWARKAYGRTHKKILSTLAQLYDEPKKSHAGEYEIRTKSGDTICWDFSSAPLGTLLDGRRLRISMAVDVTMRNQIETALRERESLFRGVFNSNMLGITFWDKKGALKEPNALFLDLIGYSRTKTDMEKLNWTELTPPEFAHRDLKALEEIRTVGVCPPYEKEFIHKDGRRIPVLIGGALLDSSKYEGVAFAIDISDRKHAEKEREILLHTLRAKTRELEQIIYITSHDLRSPLVNIQGFSKELQHSCDDLNSLMQNGATRDAERKTDIILNRDIPETLNYVHSSVAKMDSLLCGLLKISRLGRMAMDIIQIDMNEMISNVVKTFEFQISKLEAELTVEDLPDCYGDMIQLNQIFSNLIDNALKFLTPDKKGVITISGRREGDKSIYCVSDNGIGIAREHQQKVFNLFHRLNPQNGQGEGLGLSIIRKIVDRHNGRIWLVSEPGTGTKFFVALPAEPFELPYLKNRRGDPFDDARNDHSRS